MADRNCLQCGAVIPAGVRFCTECGTPAPGDTAPLENSQPVSAAVPPAAPAPQPGPAYAPQPNYAQQPVYAQPVYVQNAATPQPNPADATISTLGWLGIFLLMLLPIVNLVLLIAWACGACQKRTKRSFARATLILAVVGVILAIILGASLKSTITKALEKAGVTAAEPGEATDGKDSGGLLGGLLKGLTGGGESGDGQDGVGGLLGGLLGGESGDLSALTGLLSGDLDEDSLNALVKQFGGEDGTGSGDTQDLQDAVDALNRDAEAKGNGWPSQLPRYPDGELTESTSYRSTVTGTNPEAIAAYVETLKAHGFAYQDFYDFGLSEEDLLGVSSWQGTDGDIYVSLAFSEGTLTIDYVDELPNLDSYFN